MYCIDHIYQKLSSTESDNERRNQVEGEADKEVSQMGQKDPMQVPIQHDVGPIQVSVVEVAWYVGVSSLITEKLKENIGSTQMPLDLRYLQWYRYNLAVPLVGTR